MWVELDMIFAVSSNEEVRKDLSERGNEPGEDGWYILNWPS